MGQETRLSLAPHEIMANGPFGIPTISLRTFKASRKRVNQALWGHPGGFEALGDAAKERQVQKMKSELEQARSL